MRYHLYVDCVPINARTVAPLEAPQLAALVERAANVPGPMGGRKLTNFPALVSELQGECRDGHTACMNGVAFQANAAGHRGVLMDLALPPEPPPVKPPRKGTIADLPVEYKGKAEAEAKFRAKAAVTNATVGAALLRSTVLELLVDGCVFCALMRRRSATSPPFSSVFRLLFWTCVLLLFSACTRC